MALFLSSVFKLLFFSKLPWYSHTKQGKENLIQGQKLTTAYRKIPKRSPSTVKALKLVIVHSSVLAWISSVHIDKILAWLSFRKMYVLKASFSKNLLQYTDKNVLPILS